MADEIEKENSLNPVEGETTELETPITGQETVEEPEKITSEIEEANKKLYARMKKAEEEAKSAKEELARSKKPSSPSDSLGLAKLVSALKEFSAAELDDVALIAKAKDIPLEEAAQTEEAKILVAARREKVAKELKTPEPSSAFAGGVSSKDVAKMTSKEHQQFEENYRKKERGGME